MFFQENGQYRCAVYLRLSRSDGDQQESNSIKNQRALLNDYMGKHPELHKVDEYVDDGYSGTNFERPDFKRMMQDIEKRNVNCIIVKDLSRFGRNYIETGRYLERIFPFMGVRFIAINDHYDSAEENDDKGRILIPFNNLINDTYCRDISLRVRSHLDGTYDLFNTTVGVLLPILTLNVQDAVMRFAMDSKSNRKAIISVAMKILLVANTVVAVGLIVNAAFGISSLVKDYSIFFFLMFFMQSLSGVVTYYIRGIDKIADLSVSSVLVSAFTIGCNIVFLAVFHWGLTGYFLANIIGPLVQSLYLIARSRLIHDTDLRADFSEEKRAMLDYCKPMIANSVAWWVNNTSDRYVVIFFCGLAENGIYSVASKIPSILNIFQSIFSQAWTLSAVKDFDPEDKNGFFANTYRAYNCLMVLLCSAIIVADKILAHFLYAKDFFVAWKYVPWLTIAIVFGSLSGYVGGFFSAVKNSKIFAQSTVVGAVSNIVLNLVMTPFMGALGAAIATAVCYFVVWVIRYWHSKKFIKLKINLKRDLITYVLLAAQSIVLLLEDGIVLYGVEIGMFLVIVILYAGDLMSIAKKGKQAVQR